VSTERIGSGLSDSSGVISSRSESSSASSGEVLELVLASWNFSEGLEFNVSSRYNAEMTNEKHMKEEATRHGRKYG